MSNQNTQPITLLQCADHLSDLVYRSKPNATLSKLREPFTRVYDSQFERMGAYERYKNEVIKIQRALINHRLRHFISLVQHEGQAAIAIALNCGDGIVAKITDKQHLPGELTYRPYQLPPISRQEVGDFVVETFPWLDRHNIKLRGLEEMKAALKQTGQQFKDGDGRTDNIGRMPDGTLAVFDGDALEDIPGCNIDQRTRAQQTTQWIGRVRSNFDPIYANEAYETGESPLVSESPDFSERFSPLIQKQQAAPPTTSHAQRAASRSILNFFLG